MYPVHCTMSLVVQRVQNCNFNALPSRWDWSKTMGTMTISKLGEANVLKNPLETQERQSCD